MPGGRIRTRINAGLSGKLGGLVQSTSDDGFAVQAEGAVPAPVHSDTGNSQFQQADISKVTGSAKGSKHAGAPVATGSDPALPGSQPLTAHHFMASNPATGNHPKRGAGSKTPAQNPDKPSVTA